MDKKSTNTDITCVRVALPVPMHRLFDYLCPYPVAVGCRVRVPFGRSNKNRTAVVTDLNPALDSAVTALKSVSAVLDAPENPAITPPLFTLLQWCHRYYLHPLGEVLFSALPVLLRDGQEADFATEMHWNLSEACDNLPAVRGKRQQQALALLQDTAQSTTRLTGAGIPHATLKSLHMQGYLSTRAVARISVDREIVEQHPPLSLTGEQQQAVRAMTHTPDAFAVFLLEGITGSGKTEVYLQAMAPYLAAGKQVLVLIPEIGLTPQTLSRFKHRAGGCVVALHSGMNDRERLDTWLLCHSGQARVLIGTRSALFTSLPDLGLIIVDEEHDASYKQQDSFRYHGRDMAIVRAQQQNIPIVLGSATPSLETCNHAHSGKYQHLHLRERAGTATLPEQQIVDIKSTPLQGGLSPQLLALMRHHLDAGEQVLLFLNRRGFAPALICHDCGWSAKCEPCDHWMTLHQKQNRLVCHRCQRSQPYVQKCPSCGSHHLVPTGQGTEKLEATLNHLFPDYRIARIDKDTAANADKFKALLERIESGDAQILIGTQMLAKGHHFPNVTLVGLIEADGALFSGDYRATERFAQLYTQIAGRAGRAEKPGRVVLQTHLPEHPLLHDLLQQGYATVAKQLLSERAYLKLPPSTYQAVLRVQGRYNQSIFNFLHRCTQHLHTTHPEIELMGPVPAGHAKRNGYLRYCLIISARTRSMLSKALHQHINTFTQHATQEKIRWALDIDPIDFV